MLSNGGTQNRMPPHHEFRHMSTGSLNIPAGGVNGSSTGTPVTGTMGGFGGARSPPNKQNTSHVPCKFFRQGACQAGNSCPFSHDVNSSMDSVCKYFAKGNCKFGPKCANAHVLPDGRRVNYNPKGPMGVGGHLNLGGRVNPDAYHGQQSTLTNSFMRANGVPASPFGGSNYSPFAGPEDGYPISSTLGRQQSIDISNVPQIDTQYASHPGSQYGSPRDEDLNRFGLGLSPVNGNGLSVLDAPLPASFESNGISKYAKHGPFASSVPSKFGLDSPPSSVGAAKDGRTSEALKNLHSSAFGDDTRDRFNGTSSSPPQALGEEYYGKRIMHSNRIVRQKVMSSSLPKAVDLDWDNDDGFDETDFLPDALKDLMTPQEKARRDSRNADEGGRPILHSGTGTPVNENGSKWGSPSNASPSRWGPLFQRQKEEEEKNSVTSRTSAFGHVGSPLRNSTLHPGASPSARPIARPSLSGDSSPFVSSPPRQATVSMISQQLQRTRLERAVSGGESGLHSLSSRATSNPIGSGVPRSALMAERQVSSSSIGGSGRFTTPIDEEQGDGVFSMEEDLDEKKGEKRNSGGWTYAGGTRSPNLGPVGGGRNGVSSTTNDNGVDGMFGAR